MSVVLGIETSCDETGVAVVQAGREVLSNEVASQIDLHRVFGGVVPEIASRQHTKVISQLVEKALEDAGAEVDAVAVTVGPGLMGSLLVGVCFAKALAYAWGKPLVPVHHIEGHIFSAFLGEHAPEFPFLALIVSGGHTQLIDCRAPHQYAILGTTRDDAVGESFDKVARLLGLPYPGGPSIQQAAAGGNPEAFSFPRAMRDKDTLEFSYSGLKTAVLYALRAEGAAPAPADVAASFQAAAVDILLIKTRQALALTGARRLVVAGGVAANRLLRERLTKEVDAEVFMPPLAYCIDNGAMIAAAGDSRLRHGVMRWWAISRRRPMRVSRCTPHRGTR
ncbi:MAG: tRNA (adenosine(37)-N6)-threonylcarbamoyltransferase complex transferase subunit TsaD [Candidatus Hydrogenedentes bacterium]|nr:tRNA (adenosine(37)-N6)-threonylcarbamoyltransferase complex transferase subunit TsaD [Candidatus Hydrogenedentota bacterium]